MLRREILSINCTSIYIGETIVTPNGNRLHALIKESGAKYAEPTTKLELVSATMYGFGLIKFKLAINPESNNTVKLLP